MKYLLIGLLFSPLAFSAIALNNADTIIQEKTSEDNPYASIVLTPMTVVAPDESGKDLKKEQGN